MIVIKVDGVDRIIEQPRPVSREREVYFIQAAQTQMVKIGVADNTGRRLRGLAAANADRLRVIGVMRCANFGKLEQQLHKRFDRVRAHGEWFYPVPTLLQFIEENAYAPPQRLAKLQRELDDIKRRGRPPSVKTVAKLPETGAQEQIV